MINTNKILKAIQEGINAGLKINSSPVDDSNAINFDDAKINNHKTLSLDKIQHEYIEAYMLGDFDLAHEYEDNYASNMLFAKSTKPYKISRLGDLEDFLSHLRDEYLGSLKDILKLVDFSDIITLSVINNANDEIDFRDVTPATPAVFIKISTPETRQFNADIFIHINTLKHDKYVFNDYNFSKGIGYKSEYLSQIFDELDCNASFEEINLDSNDNQKVECPTGLQFSGYDNCQHLLSLVDYYGGDGIPFLEKLCQINVNNNGEVFESYLPSQKQVSIVARSSTQHLLSVLLGESCLNIHFSESNLPFCKAQHYLTSTVDYNSKNASTDYNKRLEDIHMSLVVYNAKAHNFKLEYSDWKAVLFFKPQI